MALLGAQALPIGPWQSLASQTLSSEPCAPPAGSPDLGGLLEPPAELRPGGGCPRLRGIGSVFQNYMGPLRLVLSPTDMAAVFINLEVSLCAARELCPGSLAAPACRLCPGSRLCQYPGPGLRCIPARVSAGPG